MDVEKLIERLRTWRRSEFGPSPPGLMFEEAAEALSHQKAAGDAMAEALRLVRDSCCSQPVGLGDGGTFVVGPPSHEALKALQPALTAWNSLEQGEGG